MPSSPLPPDASREAARNPLIAKLAHAALLSPADRNRLAQVSARTRHVGARQDIIREGEAPGDVHLVLDGWACRYKVLPGGARHNTALFLPGDFCDLHIAILGRMDHSIATLTPCTVVDIPRATILDLVQNHPRIAQALWWCTLVDEAILREWLVNLGQREASQRLAHFFCEMAVRLRAVGRAEADGYAFPLIQTELADTLGMTSVHVNRTLQDLRAAGLIALRGRYLTIPDWARLAAFSEFDPSYLHLADVVGLA